METEPPNIRRYFVMQYIHTHHQGQIKVKTLRKTNSSPLKIGPKPKRKGLSSNHQFSGAMLVSGPEGMYLSKNAVQFQHSGST